MFSIYCRFIGVTSDCEIRAMLVRHAATRRPVFSLGNTRLRAVGTAIRQRFFAAFRAVVAAESNSGQGLGCAFMALRAAESLRLWRFLTRPQLSARSAKKPSQGFSRVDQNERVRPDKPKKSERQTDISARNAVRKSTLFLMSI
jgi:hypothetical protein